MTNQEAITKLTNIMHDDHYSWHPSILTAFNMAVDALKGAKGDCISRAEAIDALSYCQTYLFDSMDKDKKVSMEDVIYALEQLPSAQPEQRWIPCSERLPKGFQTCIVTDELRQCSYEYDYNPDNEFTKRYGWRYNGRKIVAWMPLPEPWREGEADGQR